MNRTYDPHKSSLLDVDANVLSLCLYLIPMLGNLFSNSLGIIGWVLPLVVLFMEKNSPLVYFHAVQCLVMQIVVAILSAIVSVITIFSAGTSMLIGFNVFAAFGMLGILGLVMSVVSLAVIVLEIIAMIKAWNWETYHLPFFGEITKMFTKE